MTFTMANKKSYRSDTDQQYGNFSLQQTETWRDATDGEPILINAGARSGFANAVRSGRDFGLKRGTCLSWNAVPDQIRDDRQVPKHCSIRKVNLFMSVSGSVGPVEFGADGTEHLVTGSDFPVVPEPAVNIPAPLQRFDSRIRSDQQGAQPGEPQLDSVREILTHAMDKTISSMHLWQDQEKHCGQLDDSAVSQTRFHHPQGTKLADGLEAELLTKMEG